MFLIYFLISICLHLFTVIMPFTGKRNLNCARKKTVLPITIYPSVEQRYSEHTPANNKMSEKHCYERVATL